ARRGRSAPQSSNARGHVPHRPRTPHSVTESHELTFVFARLRLLTAMHILPELAAYPSSPTGHGKAPDPADRKPPADSIRREDLDERLCGESQPMRSFKNLLAKVATSPATTVPITGESGTGKDVAARALHALSPRAHGPFVN